MASLTGQLVAETYKALLKTIDNDILTASEKQITDGLGGGSNVFIDSQGFLRANKYKVTNGLATQFLKADGSLDANTYLTSITSSQIITALGYTPVPTTRTLTINGTTYDLSANRSWTVAGTAAVWGNISGTLSNQTDLQTALNAKYNNPTGTISQYIRGDGSLATFPTLPGGLPTGGTAGQILAKIDATDYNTHWIDNFATQTKNEVKLGATLAKGTAVYVSGSTGGSGTNMIVMAASNASEALSSKTFGLLETGGVTNDLVKCVTFGLLAGLDTSTAQAGDPVWLGVNGALLFGLANKPVAPANMVYIGVVTRVQSNNGEIFVNVQNGFEIEELHDVLIQSKANNQGLFYESSTGLWKNKSIATVLGYTPQAQLDGTGFVKASGTTISYDNSTYLTTSDAASTYQRLDRMAINLLASDIQYPNNNAVIAALALKANAANPVFTGNMTISGAEPKLFFTDTDNNPDYTVFIDSGVFFIYDQTAGATRFSISSTGNISSGVGKSITAGSFVKESGLATQFLKADGSIDSSTYVTSTALADYLLITTAASTYQRLDRIASSLFASATNYPNNNAVIAGLALKADAANPVFTGSMNIQGLESRINFYDENNLRKFFIGYSSGQLSIFQDAGSATRFQINSSGNITTGVNNTITSWGFIKSGGTSSQYLMADGSVSTGLANAISGSLTSGYVPKATGVNTLGNSLMYDNGSQIAISGNLELTKGANRSIIIGSAPNYDWRIRTSENDLEIRMADALTALKFYYPDGSATFINSVTATSFVKTGGTSSQFLKANGSIDSNSYALSSALGNYLPLTGGTLSGTLEVSNSSGAAWYFANRNATFSEAGIKLTTAGVGDFYFGTRNTDTTSSLHFFSYTTSTTIAQFTSGGNFLIGTNTNSGYKLDVNGSVRFSGDLRIEKATPLFVLQASASDSFHGIEFRQGGGFDAFIKQLPQTGEFKISNGRGAGWGGFMTFYTDSVERVRITPNGEFGIGVTPSGGNRFWVKGSDSTASNTTLVLQNSNNTIVHLVRNDGSAYFQGGNIAIGTTSAISQLQVGDVNTSGTGITIAARYDQSNAFLRFRSGHPNNSNIWELGNISMTDDGNYNGVMYFRTATSGMATPDIKMTLKANGNFMINTTSDNGYKLNVNGTGYFNTGLVVGSDMSMSGNLTLNTGANRFIQIGSNTNYYWRLRATGDDLEIRMADNFAALKMYYPNGAATFINTVTATAFFESSDFRLKTLINDNPIIHGIEHLQAKLYEKNGKMELGYFAQDAEIFMPYAVTKNADGFLNLSYREVHTAKIARLEKEVAELKAKLNAA
jgi:hypothetical protein